MRKQGNEHFRFSLFSDLLLVLPLTRLTRARGKEALLIIHKGQHLGGCGGERDLKRQMEKNQHSNCLFDNDLHGLQKQAIALLQTSLVLFIIPCCHLLECYSYLYEYNFLPSSRSLFQPGEQEREVEAHCSVLTRMLDTSFCS